MEHIAEKGDVIMTKRLGIGVVGCGSTGIQSVCQHTCEEDGCELVFAAAVMDPVPGRADYVARKFNIPRFYTSYDELLKDPELDAVTLASPIGVHFEQGMKAIRAGKHVHFNKTMCLSADEATEMIAEAEKYKVRLVASPGQMTSPALRRIRKAILSGEIGIPSWTIGGSEGVLYWHCTQPNRDLGSGMEKIDPTWYFKRPAGGPIWDCTVYALHAMTGIFGPAKRVTAFSGQRVPTYYFDGKPISSEVDDSTQMILDFGDAFYGVMYTSLKGDFGNYNGFSTITFGTEGRIMDGRIQGKNGEVILYEPGKMDMDFIRSNMGLPHLNDHQVGLGESHIFEDINQLADWVINGVPAVGTAEHARHVIEIIEAAYRSAETGMAAELKTSFEPIPLEEL